MDVLTASQAAAKFRVHRTTVTKWRAKGYLQPAGHNCKGHEVYDWSELIEAERMTRRSRRYSHRKATVCARS